MFAVVCVLGYSLGKVFRWLWGAARRVVWMSYRRHVLRLTDVDARTKRLETVNSDLEERCGVLEERLMVRRLPILNLPDSLPPESISAAVRQYERQHGYRDLWQAVKRCLLMSSDGYVVIDHKEGGGGVGSAGSQYYQTRRQAESGLGRSSGGMLLVHVIAPTGWRREIVWSLWMLVAVQIRLRIHTESGIRDSCLLIRAPMVRTYSVSRRKKTEGTTLQGAPLTVVRTTEERARRHPR